MNEEKTNEGMENFPTSQTSSSTESYNVSIEGICSECGAAFPKDDMMRYGESFVCANCKPVFVQKLKEGLSLAGEMVYAGFWLRFLAKVIDGILLVVVNWAFGFLINLLLGVPSPGTEASNIFAVQQLVNFVVSIIIPAAYTTWFLGRYGATLGKMACSIHVVRPDGSKISYGRALGRHFAEYLSTAIFLIGYIMAAFDSQKRALHDHICNTRVTKKS
jgi:uncharacterized RDD family membrane protein YckC